MKETARDHRTHPPIIIENDNLGLSVLSAYVRKFIGGDLSQYAEDEAVRLQSYLDALAVRTNFGQSARQAGPRIPGKIITYHSLPKDDSAGTGPVPFEKGRMKAIFTGVADDTKNLILSEFSILPGGSGGMVQMLDTGDSGDIKKQAKTVMCGDYHADMGFIQYSDRKGKRSVLLPALELDLKILKMMEGSDHLSVFRPLQNILTAVNHDVLHHLTMPVVFPNSPVSTKDVYHLIKSMVSIENHKADQPGSYESWALISHASTWREMKGSKADSDLRISIDQFFDALGTLDREMEAAGRTIGERHSVIDYFSTLGGFSLMRIYGFNDPLMKRVLERMESVSPQPARVIAEAGFHALETVTGKYREFCHVLTSDSSFLTTENLKWVQDCISFYNGYDLSQKGHPEFKAPRLMSYINGVTRGDIAALGSEETDGVIEDLEEFSRLMVGQYGNGLAGGHFLFSVRNSVARAIHENFEQVPYRDILLHAFQDHLHGTREHFEPSEISDERTMLRDRESSHSMLDKTLANYTLSGQSLLDAEHASPYVVAKRLQMIKMAPEIAFLASPVIPGSPLDKIHKNAESLDGAVIRLLDQTL